MYPPGLSDKEKKALYYQANKEKKRLYYESIKDKIKARYQAKRAELIEYQKQYVNKHKLEVEQYQHEYYLRVLQKKRGHNDRVPKAPRIREITKTPNAKAFRIVPVVEVKEQPKIKIIVDKFLITFD